MWYGRIAYHALHRWTRRRQRTAGLEATRQPRDDRLVGCGARQHVALSIRFMQFCHFYQVTLREGAVRNDKVDPAALLIAIIPVAGSPLIEEGAWDKLNTVLAGVVLVVLWAYAVAGERRRQARSVAECVAVGAVIGLVAAVAVAFPTQALWAWTISSDEPPMGPSESAINLATWWSLAFGLTIAIVVTDLLRRSQDSRSQDPVQTLIEEVREVRMMLEGRLHPEASPRTGQAPNPADAPPLQAEGLSEEPDAAGLDHLQEG
jgi:hypothetical protein